MGIFFELNLVFSVACLPQVCVGWRPVLSCSLIRPILTLFESLFHPLLIMLRVRSMAERIALQNLYRMATQGGVLVVYLDAESSFGHMVLGKIKIVSLCSVVHVVA